jgi:hypothetical protein
MLTRILDFDILKIPQSVSLLFESAVVTPALTVTAHEKTEIRHRIDGTTGGRTWPTSYSFPAVINGKCKL